MKVQDFMSISHDPALTKVMFGTYGVMRYLRADFHVLLSRVGSGLCRSCCAQHGFNHGCERMVERNSSSI